ncbi:MAG: hypothetical protein IKS30_05835 [Treponema sp.]|nr:hypothetical protein [Treponema sp.]
MLTNKKSFFVAVVCLFATVFLQAQSATADLTKRYLERANTQYESAQYLEAYKTINAVLRLNENTGIPANVTLVATEIYSKVLDNIKKDKNYSLFTDVTDNVQKYSVIADGSIQRKIKEIYAQQESELQAKKEAAEKAEKAEQQAMYQQQLDEQRKSQESFMDAIQKSQENMQSSIVVLGDKLVETSEKSAKSNHIVLVAVLIICAILVVVFIIVILGIRAAARASARQSMQFEETLKLVAGMQQANNQLLLGNVTDLDGMGGLRSAGSSRWGVDALPAPEMKPEEKDELKQLAIKCEELGAQIDAITKRKNNSKNVSELVYKLAMELGLNQNTSMLYFCAAMVYDAGFLDVPEDILAAENLTDEQRQIIRNHVNVTGDHLDFVPEKYRNIFTDAALYHHENEDGSGYPNGLAGEDIPQIAKLIHVVESYNSLISRRNYKQIMDKESAIEELLSKKNMYDETVVKALDGIV